MSKLSAIMRYPLKSHGREALEAVALEAGQSMPFDRQWAVAHETARLSGDDWASCRNFMRVAGTPSLAAISSQFDEQSNTLTLRHPARPDLSFDPDKDEALFLNWIAPLILPNRAQPARIVRVAGARGYTDSDFPSVTLCNLASHRAVEEKAGQSLSVDRWRGNLWFDTGTPWEEFDWIGRQVSIGGCTLEVIDRTERCMTTAANPDTGQRDVDTLGVLDRFGHQDFSVLAKVVSSGTVAIGDTVSVL